MVSLNRSLHTLCILIRLSCKELFKLSKVPYWLVIHSLNLDADSLLWKIQLIFVDFNSVSKRLETESRKSLKGRHASFSVSFHWSRFNVVGTYGVRSFVSEFYG